MLQDVESVEGCHAGGAGPEKGPMMETGGKKRKKKTEGNSSDEEDDVSDDVLADLAEMDEDNDDIEEFSDLDDEDEDDEDDDIGSSDSDCDLRKSVEETKSKQLKTSPESACSKKSKVQVMVKRKKESGVKRALESKNSEAEPEIELAVGGAKKQKVDSEMKVNPNSLPSPVDARMWKPRVGSAGPRGAPAPNLWGRGPRWSRDSGQGAVMTELANLVGAAGGPHEMFPGHFRFRPDPSPVFRNSDLFEAQSEDGSTVDREAHSPSPASSHASGKSDKNLGDFADEESTDEEMVRLAQAEQLGSMLHQHQHLATMAQFYQYRMAGAGPGGQTRKHGGAGACKIMSRLTMDKVAEPGNTLLWDLIQDGSIELLAEGLALEAERALTNLLEHMDRFIRVKFIEVSSHEYFSFICIEWIFSGNLVKSTK